MGGGLHAPKLAGGRGQLATVYLRQQNWGVNQPGCQPGKTGGVAPAARGSPGWGGHVQRSCAAAPAGPCLRAGIASVLIEVPTYGRRRVPGQVRHYPVDVSTYLRTSVGCMWEGPGGPPSSSCEAVTGLHSTVLCPPPFMQEQIPVGPFSPGGGMRTAVVTTV